MQALQGFKCTSQTATVRLETDLPSDCSSKHDSQNCLDCSERFLEYALAEKVEKLLIPNGKPDVVSFKQCASASSVSRRPWEDIRWFTGPGTLPVAQKLFNIEECSISEITRIRR